MWTVKRFYWPFADENETYAQRNVLYCCVLPINILASLIVFDLQIGIGLYVFVVFKFILQYFTDFPTSVDKMRE